MAAVHEVKDTTCAVCHEHYTEPKILPCAHLLCRDCLVSWTKAKKNAACPMCRSVIVDPQDSDFQNKTCEEVADMLPTDLSMTAMIDSNQVFKQKHLCYVHNDVKSKSLCMHCGIMLCQNCVDGHRIVPVTAAHRLQNLETLTLENLASSRSVPCAEHPDKTAELFCTAHSIFICLLCATSKHKPCAEVTCMKELVAEHREKLLDMEIILRESESALNSTLTDVEVHLAKSEKNAKDAFAEIDAICNSLLISVEACRKRLKKIVSDANDKVKTTVQNLKQILSQRRGKMASHLLLLERVQEMSNGSSLVAMVPMLSHRFRKLDLDASIPRSYTAPSIDTWRLSIDRGNFVHMKRDLEKIGELVTNVVSIERKISSGTQRVWQFNSDSEAGIYLSNSQRTADFYGTNCENVKSLKPLEPCFLYEVLVEEIQHPYYRNMKIGVLFSNTTNSSIAMNSERMTVLINDRAVLVNGIWCLDDNLHQSHKGWTIAVDYTWFPQSGVKSPLCCSMTETAMWKGCTEVTKSSVGAALQTVVVGSRAGVLIDDAQCLHLYVDGIDQGVVCRGLKQSCYFIVWIAYHLEKITTLPLTRVQPTS